MPTWQKQAKGSIVIASIVRSKYSKNNPERHKVIINIFAIAMPHLSDA
jgi:hypothetical protein